MENYCKFTDNQVCDDYLKYLGKIRFEDKLSRLVSKYRNKKILIYGNGILFNIICDNYDLKKYLNICAVSDLRYEKNEIPEYKGFKAVKPSEIKSVGAEAILISNINPAEIKKFLIQNNFAEKNIPIEALIQNTIFDKLSEFKHKLNLALEYIKLTRNIFLTVKYLYVLNDTEYQSKINYTKIISTLKKDKNRKVRVAFLCEENSKWGYQSVYDEMIKDENFEVLPIINYPIITTERQDFSQEKNIEFFKTLNISAIDGFDYAKNIYKPLSGFKPDIVFYQQPWYMKHFLRPENVSEYALTCIVSYGFTSIDTKSWGSDDVRKNSGNLWKMFTESKYHNKFYETAANIKYKDIAITKGYPKLDYYKAPIAERFEQLWKDGSKEDKHRIIWAPHYSIEKYRLGMSNFKEQYLYFLNLAKKHTEYNFIVKPHPSLRHECISKNFLTEKEYDAYIEEWNSLDNAAVYTEGNYFDIFKTSDVLITDSSSFLAEYFYSGKPVIFFESPNRAGFNKFGLKLKKGFYMPSKTEDTEKLLEKLLILKEDYLKPVRENIIKKEFYYPKNGVGVEIVNYIRTMLNRRIDK